MEQTIEILENEMKKISEHLSVLRSVLSNIETKEKNQCDRINRLNTQISCLQSLRSFIVRKYAQICSQTCWKNHAVKRAR